MLKTKLFIILIILFNFFIKIDVFAVSNFAIPVEDAFSDISRDYKYYYELKTLYDKGIIEPENDGKFHPEKLLKRDEFVGIAEETSCKKCIVPNVSKEFFDKYKQKPFFDVGIQNKYFYCIADAKNDNFVLGYKPGDSCKDGTKKSGEIPFCLNNNITFEEALAVVMRMGGILTNKQAEIIISGIKNGQIFSDLSFDVKPKYIDGTINSFYPYFKKALEYQVVDYDNLGKKKIYKLVEKKGKYLRPKTLISKEDFLKMAFIALKANSCIDKISQEPTLAIRIKIFNKKCTEKKEQKGLCKLSDLESKENVYDFSSEVGGICQEGIDNKKGYIWRFYNLDTGTQIIKYGKYIDNYNFLDSGKYNIFLRITDNCGNTSEVYNTLNILGETEEDLGLNVIADKVYGEGPLEVNFDGKVEGGEGPYRCSWDYGDGTTGKGEDTNHIFKTKGIFLVKTKCIDVNGLTSEVSTSIKVVDDLGETEEDLGLNVIADKVYGEGPLEVNFDGKVEGGEGPYKCSWDYGDGTTGKGEDTNHIFKTKGIYLVKTKCIDVNGLTSEVTTSIKVVDDLGKTEEDLGDLSVSIDADPIIGNGPLEVDFTSIVGGGKGPFSYIWNFGDGMSGKGKVIKHIFIETGIYEVNLIVIDGDGNKGNATVFVNVLDNKCSNDSDLDGINDCEDKCPLIKGVIENEGCPIFLPPSDDPNNGLSKCLRKQENSSFIFGNVSCNSCPCTKSIDFRSTIRNCDTIIPAITSPSEKNIYSRGKLFQITN